MNRFITISLALIAISVTSCSKGDPDRTGYNAPALVASDLATDSIMPWVERFSQVHLNDIPIDNTGFPPGHLFPSDHLTRDSAVGLFSSALLSMGYKPDTAVLSDGNTVTYNVFAEWPGTTKAGEVILVAGHIDAFYGGADDNTSAIAAILETARAIRKHQFARTIRFIAFDLEEFGSIGSTRYIEAGMADDVNAAIVLDLVGYASKEPKSQKDVMGIRLPDVGDYLMVLGNKDSEVITQKITDMSHYCGLANTLGVLAPGDGTYFLSSVFMRSDHGLMWYKGIPAVFLTDGANFRNPNYHMPSDLPSTIDKEFLVNNTRLLTAAIALLAEVQK
jgi:hypothetical protein